MAHIAIRIPQSFDEDRNGLSPHPSAFAPT
jgi:hypothetical protein